ncbi:hypothetical protein J6A64_05595 [bacterium]|nr:hypothetical protein [bacterium]
MQVNKFDSTTFNGRIGAKTLNKFKETLTPQDFKTVKNFRIGQRNTNIDILVINNPQRLANRDEVFLQNETFAVISNSKTPNKPGAIVKLANAKLPFDMNTFKMITKDIVQYGEKILAKNNK